MLTLAIVQFVIREVQFQDWAFRTGPMDQGFFLQATFDAIGNGDSIVSEQHGRKWYISAHATESEVVQTALKAVLTALEHEARESFTYKGVALFGPHIDVKALLQCAERQDRRREVTT